MADTFTLKQHHLELARNMYINWHDCETGAPEVDPKRPYGYVPSDVAGILGEPWPDENKLFESEYDRQVYEIESRMLSIHREMEIALQILLGMAGEKVVPGVYENIAERYSRPKWVLVSATDIEPLTDAMIRSLRTEAANAGDVDQVKSCDAALRGGFLAWFSRAQCAASINRSRGMENKPFVRVIP